MKLVKSVLVASAMALACGTAFAADKDEHKGFNDMDKNADGKLTRAEAKGNKDVLARWKEADKDNDGTLSRTEYLTVMAKKDANTVKEKVSKEVGEAKRRAPDANASSSGGSTKQPASSGTGSGAPK
jgi:hypothetical protein